MVRRKVFRVVLIKPSHYDDDGYVIQWVRSAIPSNSLASLYALAAKCAENRVLGTDVDMSLRPTTRRTRGYDLCRLPGGCVEPIAEWWVW